MGVVVFDRTRVSLKGVVAPETGAINPGGGANPGGGRNGRCGDDSRRFLLFSSKLESFGALHSPQLKSTELAELTRKRLREESNELTVVSLGIHC